MFNWKEKAIEALQGIFDEFIDGFFEAAFDILSLFLLEPTSFDNYPFFNDMKAWIYGAAITIGAFLTIYNFMKYFFQDMGGFAQRSASEIGIKAVFGAIMAGLAPVIVTEFLIGLNNLWVKGILAKGVNADKVKELMMNPTEANLVLSFFALVMAILLIVLAIQYIIRLGELGIQLLSSSIAAFSMVNEDINIWPVWWRETIATVFQQAYQITILWVILNLLTGGEELGDYMMAIGLMAILLKGPGFLRQILYSTGAGRSVAGAAGGTGKMMVYRLAAKKIIK